MIFVSIENATHFSRRQRGNICRQETEVHFGIPCYLTWVFISIFVQINKPESTEVHIGYTTQHFLTFVGNFACNERVTLAVVLLTYI